MIVALRVIRAAARLQIAQVSADRFMVFTVVLQPFFIAVIAMYLLRARADFDPMYVVIGAGLSGLWSAALFEGTWAIQSERWQGTLELVTASTAPFLLILGGRMAGSMAFSLLSMVVTYAIGAWLFGYTLVVHNPVGFVASLPFALFSFWSLSLVFAPVGILWRAAGRFLGIFEYPVYSLSGFLFPILLMPAWSQPLSYALPPYWAAVALHGTAAGQVDTAALLSALAALTTGCVLSLVAAQTLLVVVVMRARRDGTLALT